jgi:transcriptional regulator NrdR family protein
MHCKCGGKLGVYDTRENVAARETTRKLKCRVCGMRVRTLETILEDDAPPPIIRKPAKSREEEEVDRLLKSMKKQTNKPIHTRDHYEPTKSIFDEVEEPRWSLSHEELECLL